MQKVEFGWTYMHALVIEVAVRFVTLVFLVECYYGHC